MKDIQFVSYDGRWPNLCSGTLILSIDGKQHSFKYCLSSGGQCGFENGDYSKEYVTEGPWSFSNYNDDIKFTDNEIVVIEHLINDNIPFGCCGGCL